MKGNSSTRFGAPATYSKKLLELRHSVAFRLTLWYAGIFTVSLLGTLLAFYLIVLHGTHGISPHALSELREAFRHYFGTPLAAVIALSAVAGWFMAKRALSGVGEVTRTAMDISKGALDRRVPVKGRRDEIDRLAETFNSMVDRVQVLIEQMKEMTDNIAHDLRSPLTRMRGVAEMALLDGDSSEEHKAMAGTIVEECDRLLGMINTMLDISEAEAGLARLHLQDVDLLGLLRDVCDLFQPLAEDRGIDVRIEGPESLTLSCDPPKLQRVFANLLDNALKYTPSGGFVRISVKAHDRDAQVVVEDTGAGIAEEDLVHIFDRFFRGEKSRSEMGSGLGLSLAHALVLSHRGAITVRSETGHGARFTVTLPGRALPGDLPGIKY